MRKTFIFLLSTLFMFSIVDTCLARGGGERGGRPPERGQSRSTRIAGSRSTTRQGADSTSSEQNAESDFFKADNGNAEQSGRFGGRRGMNPPPPPPLDADGNPMPPPDDDESGYGEDDTEE